MTIIYNRVPEWFTQKLELFGEKVNGIDNRYNYLIRKVEIPSKAFSNEKCLLEHLKLMVENHNNHKFFLRSKSNGVLTEFIKNKNGSIKLLSHNYKGFDYPLNRFV